MTLPLEFERFSKSPTLFAFLNLLAVRSGRAACLAALSAVGGGPGVPSSTVAAAAVSIVPNSAASFSARFEALWRLLNSGWALHQANCISGSCLRGFLG